MCQSTNKQNKILPVLLPIVYSKLMCFCVPKVIEINKFCSIFCFAYSTVGAFEAAISVRVYVMDPYIKAETWFVDFYFL
jgi:hypothetical protein